jgi:hypothetical protein
MVAALVKDNVVLSVIVENLQAFLKATKHTS